MRPLSLMLPVEPVLLRESVPMVDDRLPVESTFVESRPIVPVVPVVLLVPVLFVEPLLVVVGVLFGLVCPDVVPVELPVVSRPD